MRILLDESAPRALKRILTDHDVETAPDRGWASLRNGELLGLAVSEGFDVFVTPDQSLPHQQNLASFHIAVVVLACGLNRMATYEPLADELRQAIESAVRGAALVFTA
jgi:hypothetical protein